MSKESPRLLVRLFDAFSKSTEGAETHYEWCQRVLQQHAASHPEMLLEVIDVKSHPKLYHKHCVGHLPSIRVYRDNTQLDFAEARTLLPKEISHLVGGRPTQFDLQKRGLRMKLPVGGLEWEAIPELLRKSRRSQWWYHLDETGREWGPFTPGQMTLLYNRGICTSGTRVRSEESNDWVPYGPDGQRLPESKGRSYEEQSLDEATAWMDRGDKLVPQLIAHVTKLRFRQKFGEPIIPADIPIDPHFAEDQLGFVCVGGKKIDGNLAGFLLHYADSGQTRASVLFGPVLDGIAVPVDFELVAKSAFRLEPDRLQEQGYDAICADLKFEEPRRLVTGTAQSGKQHLWLWWSHRYAGGDRHERWIRCLTVTQCATGCLTVLYIFPNWMSTSEAKRFPRFVELAFETVGQDRVLKKTSP